MILLRCYGVRWLMIPFRYRPLLERYAKFHYMAGWQTFEPELWLQLDGVTIV